ncbi:APC family permease [Acidicapsa ligni]|uniref:APC family permease n=1 Tax=Acidicapsa ligni TaxID=542300 RepID=UPI0021E057F2|nr:APC family permease [Acidicapsa ligni]
MPDDARPGNLGAGNSRTGNSRASNHLKRILGLGFGVAVIFGGTVGVGILRLPGMIAEQLQSEWLILLVWVLGGIYALLGAVSVAELGVAMPQAGGFYVYSRRAFGPGTGFAMGWTDWLNNCAVIAYGAVAAAEYIASLLPGVTEQDTTLQKGIALGLLALFCGLHWLGLRVSSGIQKITSVVTAVTFVVLAVACFLHPRVPHVARFWGAGTAPGWAGWMALLVPMVAALRAIMVTYDGWYAAIYFTEEDTDAAKHLPRLMISGVLVVMGLYLLMNLAFLHVLSIPEMANSRLPAAEAARLVLPAWSGKFVTVLSLLTLLGLINAVLLGAPRILLAIGRDGLFSRRAAWVSENGTPGVALLLSAAMAAVFLVSGRLEEIIAVAAILVAGMYCVNYIAVFRLRSREPRLKRPFRAWGYPLSTGVVLAGSLVFLVAAIHDDPLSAAKALVLLMIAVPAYLWMRGRAKLT